MRVGVLEPIAVDDPEALARVTAFAQGLQQLGWTASRNVRIDYRWGASASRASKTSTREKKPAMAGAGKRGDMDDEIPF
jgi:hypothetical protein